MEKKIGFFQDAPNSDSITRLMFFIGLIWSMLMTSLLAIITQSTAFELISFFTATSGVFISLKLMQNYQEKDSVKKEAGEEK